MFNISQEFCYFVPQKVQKKVLLHSIISALTTSSPSSSSKQQKVGERKYYEHRCLAKNSNTIFYIPASIYTVFAVCSITYEICCFVESCKFNLISLTSSSLYRRVSRSAECGNQDFVCNFFDRLKTLQLTLLPRIWLIAALSFNVHSATTFALISFMYNMKAFRGFLMCGFFFSSVGIHQKQNF